MVIHINEERVREWVSNIAKSAEALSRNVKINVTDADVVVAAIDFTQIRSGEFMQFLINRKIDQGETRTSNINEYMRNRYREQSRKNLIEDIRFLRGKKRLSAKEAKVLKRLEKRANKRGITCP